MIRSIVLIAAFGFAGQLLWAQQIENEENLTFALQGQISEISTIQNVLLKKVIELNIANASIEDALMVIAEELDLKLMYSEEALPLKHRVSINNKRMTLYEALWEVLAGTGLKFAISSNRQLVVIKNPEYSEEQVSKAVERTISGTVTDAESGEAVPGATIIVEGTSIGTTTDMEGNFSLTVPDDTESLLISFVGYQSKEVTISGRNEINVELEQDLLMMDEMVVIGYGEQRASNITGSIASVSTDEITQVTASGVQGALQGRVSGVNVTPQDGRPGGQMDMDIRGVATFGNNNPLYVIDGVPVFDDRGSTGYYGEGGNTNPLATLNPNQIESVEILKDASAAAIYGARAGNGVVLITTKSGANSEPIFSVDVKRGVSAVPEHTFINMMNTDQFVDFTIEAYQNAGLPLPISMQEPHLSDNLTRNTNWQDAAFNPAVTQNYNFGVSGGSETARYAFNGGYSNEEGTLVNSGFERFSANIKAEFDIGESMIIGGSFNLSRSIWNGLYNPTIDFIQEILQSPPTQPIYDEENLGGFAGPKPEYSPVNRDNKIGRFALLDQETSRDRIIGNTNFQYNILDNLSYRINMSIDVGRSGDYVFDPRYDMDNRSNNEAALDEMRMSTDSYIIENTLNYQTVLKDRHDLALLAGYTVQESESDWISAGINGFPSNDTRVIDAGEGSFGVGGNRTEWGLISQLGRANYSYNDTYNLMVTVRRDGSSRFGSDNRYGIFPSFSGSWNVSNESFMDDMNWISSLQLRASWGQVGSQGIDNYAARSGIQPGITVILGENQLQNPAASFTTMGNSELKWETTTQTNVGATMELLEGDLTLTADYYVKDTEDILLRVPISSTSGINRDSGPFVNAGSMTNKGIELEADYRNSVGELNYTVSGNISTNKNEVTALGSDGNDVIIHNVAVGWATATTTTITKPGEPMGSFYGYIADGTFEDQADVNNHATQEAGTAPGDVKFRDLNDDGVINGDDQTIIGNPFPDFTYGLSVNFDYKSFDLGIFLQGKQGHDIYNLTWADLNTTPQYNNQTTMMLDRWTPENRNTDVPRAVKDDPNNNNRSSTRFVEDGSYLRIQNIQLGYELSPQLLEKIQLTRLRFYASVKNLYTFTKYRGYNPEIGELDSGPRSSLSRGIDLGVYPIPRIVEGGFQVYF